MGQAEQALIEAAKLCRQFEGFSATPYLCPANYPTIGYGTVNKPDGTVVKMTDSAISKDTAEQWLMHELDYTYLRGVLKCSPHLISYPGALAAMSDFAYNLGVPRYRASTLRRRIDELKFTEAKQELKKWTMAGGKILPGLVRRRLAECALF